MTKALKPHWQHLFIAAIACLQFASCRKWDLRQKTDPLRVEMFLATQRTSDKEIARLIGDFRDQIEKNDFTTDFLAYNGQPLWDASVKFKSNDNDFALIVPTKKVTDSEMRTFFIARYKNGEFKYEMHRKENLQKGIKEPESWNFKKEKVQTYFHYFDLNVLHLPRVRHIDFEGRLASLIPSLRRGKEPVDPSWSSAGSSSPSDTTGYATYAIRVWLPDTSETSSMMVDNECRLVEVWINPDGDYCWCSGDEKPTGETYWIGDCESGGGYGGGGGGGGGEGGPPGGGDGGGSGWLPPHNGGGGGGGYLTCFWYMPCYALFEPPPPPVVRDSTYFKNLLNRYCSDVGHSLDSMFGIAQRDSVEWSCAIIERSSALKLAVNFKTDNDPLWVRVNDNVFGSDTLKGEAHTHQRGEDEKKLDDQCGPDDGDFLALSRHLYLKDYFSIVELGGCRYVFVIEDNQKAQSFFYGLNQQAFSDIFREKVSTEPSYYSNYRKATESAMIKTILSYAKESGIGIYLSVNTTKDQFIKIF